MSIQSRSHQYGTVFENWQILELLGQGSGGKTAVFRLKRIDSNRGQSALKVINLIEERGDFDSMPAYLKKEYEDAREDCKSSALQEVWLMDDFQGNTNIVDYLDHKFVDWIDESGFGCDMLIRMELLKDLRSEIRSGAIFTEADVIKIGCDICQALILCHENSILHRDIKPENIFVNRNGNYKLGDFGVSRIISNAPMSMASTSIGTLEYAAPEQTSGKYDKRVDIYSLGLVLYELSNQCHLPFATSFYVRPNEVNMRMAGVPLPPPAKASEELAAIIMKACAYKADDRYQTANELLTALSALSRMEVIPSSNSKPFFDAVTTTPYSTEPALAANEDVQYRPAQLAVALGCGEYEPEPTVADLPEDVPSEYHTVPATPTSIHNPHSSYETVPAIDDATDTYHSPTVRTSRVKETANNSKKTKAKRRPETQPQYRYFGNKRAKKCFPGLVPPVIQIPDKTDIILSEAFRGITNGFTKDVEEVIVPEGVFEIQANAFDFIRINKYISLPDTLTEIGENAFTLSDGAYVKCGEGTVAHRYCKQHGLKNTAEMDMWRKYGRCQHCGGSLSILLRKCKNCGRRKDY